MSKQQYCPIFCNKCGDRQYDGDCRNGCNIPWVQKPETKPIAFYRNGEPIIKAECFTWPNIITRNSCN